MISFEPDDVLDPETGQTAWDFMLEPCRSKEELRQWLILFLNIDPPDSKVDPDSNCTPLDMAWKVYSNCLWWDEPSILPPENREAKMIFYASRFSFKTFLAAAVEFAVAIHDKRGVIHTAATLDQARKAYNDYFQSFLKKPLFRPFRETKEKETADQFKFGNGTNIKIIPCTKQAAQSQHESLLCRDEIDVVVDKSAYYDLDGIPIDI